jgi:hypothetical protein
MLEGPAPADEKHLTNYQQNDYHEIGLFRW